MANILEHISVFHGYLGQLLDYILEMPLATFDMGIAEIFTISFSDGIIIVPPSSQMKHPGLNLYPGTFFSLATISLKNLKNWAMSHVFSV